MLLLICIFEGTLSTFYNFLNIYLKVLVSEEEGKNNDKDIQKYYLIEMRENIECF
ncbi:hypothetical protein Hanom_Chr12g01120711 [Helianthus anomalus]